MLTQINKNRGEFLLPMVFAIAISTPLVFFSGHHIAVIVAVSAFSIGSSIWWISEAMIKSKAGMIMKQAKVANVHLGSQLRAFEKSIDSGHCHNHWLVHQVATALGVHKNASLEEKWHAIRKERHGMTSLLKHLSRH